MPKDGIEKFGELKKFMQNNRGSLLPGVSFGCMLNDDQELCMYFGVEKLSPELHQNIRDFSHKSAQAGFNLGCPIIREGGKIIALESP